MKEPATCHPYKIGQEQLAGLPGATIRLLDGPFEIQVEAELSDVDGDSIPKETCVLKAGDGEVRFDIGRELAPQGFLPIHLHPIDSELFSEHR